MSARDWTQCPQCLARERANRTSMESQLAKAYGTIPREQFESLSRECDKPIRRTQTLRVDYEIGVCEDAEFAVWFGVSCENCGYEFKFQHKEQTKVVIE